MPRPWCAPLAAAAPVAPATTSFFRSPIRPPGRESRPPTARTRPRSPDAPSLPAWEAPRSAREPRAVAPCRHHRSETPKAKLETRQQITEGQETQAKRGMEGKSDFDG